MATILKGKPAADRINADILARTPSLYEKGIVPALAIVRVGENPSDIAYENGAVKKAKSLGLQPEKYICPADIAEEDLIQVIRAVNADEKIHGILLLQPLPKALDAVRVRNALAAEKDLDCISDDALGWLFTGRGGFGPCTAESCIRILKQYGIEIEGKRAVVIGRSMVIGKPAALMLLKENATVTVCHTKTKPEDLRKLCRDADIIIAAAGRRNTVTADMVREGQVILDVGINFDEEGRITGDVDFEPVCAALGASGAITPVPGGVGSVTTSLLMEHLAEAAARTVK